MKKPARHWRDYRTASGGRPVKTAIDALGDEEVASIVAGMKDVVARGLRHESDEVLRSRSAEREP
jgi:hypothetical protein